MISQVDSFLPEWKIWRSGPESNRHTRICSPLHHHSATGPEKRLPACIPAPAARVKGFAVVEFTALGPL